MFALLLATFVFGISSSSFFAPGGIVTGADEVVFEDDFDGCLLDGWEWIRENKAHWCVRDDGLEIRIDPGTADSVVNALIRELPDRKSGAIAVEVDVTNFAEPRKQYEQAGLTLYQDGKPVFKFVKELVDGQVMIVPGRKPVASNTARIRLVVTENTYTARYRVDESDEFETAAAGDLPPPNNEQISIQ